jgi:valyl-tRNA synthetase
MKELAPRFNFNEIDEKWSKAWVKHGYFQAKSNPDKKPFTVVIPPPNVTGILHMGHALNNTLQDIIVRYKRMNGYEALWMPGTDHAGIATQNVVEKQLAKEGKKRQDLGREAFVQRLWDWKKQYGDTIIHQLEKIGASCDWSRTRFTMDDNYSESVQNAFSDLYKKGLIYRGEYIINWCPRCQTALSDEEAEHHETNGNLYHIRYFLKDHPTQFVTVATTRPETMLGDTAVAVNPKDERYKNFIGKFLLLPVGPRVIKIIADDFVDPAFGSGAVKVTPAHDPNDFAMGQRHQLEFINVMHPDGRMNEWAGDFNGMDRFEAREALVETLKKSQHLTKVEPHSHAVGHCYRCHTIVEPYLSKQWFVKMKPLAERALEAVKSGKITFYPERWSKVYLNWMENIRDWCISRQIWWGHRIPIWYCMECLRNDRIVSPRLEKLKQGFNVPPEEMRDLFDVAKEILSDSKPLQCPHCKSQNPNDFIQDPDVLDTWFSSWLWPFATLDWRKRGDEKAIPDLKYFYPTSTLFTASEIIFFWVARMIMAGYEFMDGLPFKDVYIHGTVRDAQGRKMSKSLGNAIDPLEIIKEYGADALRFSLIINSGQDLYISKEKFEIGRNFANKIWNASRLILMNTQSTAEKPLSELAKDQNLDLPSKWIISRFYQTLEKISGSIEQYRYSEAETALYEFFWGNFCDWYLEIIKDRWSDETIQMIARQILKESIKMIHPFMPFVTEELWEYCQSAKDPLCLQEWPAPHQELVNEHVNAQMQTLIDVIASIRNVRTQWNIKPNVKVTCLFVSGKTSDRALIESNQNVLLKLARIENVTVHEKLNDMKDAAVGIVQEVKFIIPLGEVIDVEKEKGRILTQITDQRKLTESLAQRLNNKNFVERAPKDIVEKDQERLLALQKEIIELERVISGLN